MSDSLIERQARVIADLKFLRFINLRDHLLEEIKLKQQNPRRSCQEILEFAERTHDPFKPNPSKIKAYETF